MTRLLLVDDDPDIRRVTELTLTRLGGFEVDAVGSGEEALRMAAATPPDAILLDVMMPGMDGPTTLRGLRSSPTTRDIPVIFMTARVQSDERARYLDLGVQGVIGKPFDPMTLPDSVRSLLEG